MTQHRRTHGQYKQPSASKPKTAKQSKPRRGEQPHQHILTAQRGYSYRLLVCVVKGCHYSERWDAASQQYHPFNVTPCGSLIGTSAALQEQADTAIRPVSLWGEAQP